MSKRTRAILSDERKRSEKVFRRFSDKDRARFLSRLKKYLKEQESAAFDVRAYQDSDPEFVGWYMYTQNNLSNLSWLEIEKLIAGGFFNEREKNWLENYHKLIIFKEVMGHTRVPARWKKNRQLSTWVHRHRGKGYKVPDHFRKLLDAIGFEWRLMEKTPTAPWDEMYVKLTAYRKRFGHCEVPAKWPEDKKLGYWVSVQRLHSELLNEEQVARLNELGFNWDIRGNLWKQHYENLCAFKKKYGHCRVPGTSTEFPGLADWVSNTRQRRHRLTRSQIRKLDRLGFSWNPDKEYWQNHYEAFKAFVETNGHPFVPARFAENPSLGIWVAGQRDSRKKGNLEEEKIRLLDEAGFVWSVAEWRWMQKFKELEAFKQRFGHCRVPAKNWPENPSLASWLCTQRYKWDQLPSERRRRLEELGFSPDYPNTSLPANIRAYLNQ